MKLKMKLRTLLSSCAIALPLFASTAISSPRVNAYPLAKITNNTQFTATGTIEYLSAFCSDDNYSVAPGKTWTASSRGICLISEITSNLSNGPSVVSYTSTGTGYSNFLIQPTGSGYRVFSDSEYDKYSDKKIDGGPGFYIVNKTDWPLAISLDQVGCLYHDTVGKGDVFKRHTGAVWFTIAVNIQPDGQTKSDWDCVAPVAEVVGDVLLAAATGGFGAFQSIGRATTRTVIKTTVKGAVRETLEPLAEFTAEQIGKLIADNGNVELKGQYAGYPWPFECNKMPEYHVTGGPSLKLVDGRGQIGQGTKLTITKVNSCGDNMMTASSKSVSANPKLDWNQFVLDELADNENTQTPISLVKSLVGNYENHLYDRGGKNDWHYVTISQIDDTTLEWRNRAGVTWTLKTTQNKEILNVSNDSPYFSEGHTSVKVVWDGNQVSGLIGPGNELYQKSR